MNKSIVELHYDASIVVEFDSSNLNDEGAVLDKAREIAEGSDIRMFNLSKETAITILSR